MIHKFLFVKIITGSPYYNFIPGPPLAKFGFLSATEESKPHKSVVATSEHSIPSSSNHGDTGIPFIEKVSSSKFEGKQFATKQLF